MKIAIVSDDHKTISAHFGRAAYYEIFTLENGHIIERHVASKSCHHHVSLDEPPHEGHSHNHDHNAMIQPILGCAVLITHGMGTGAYNALKLNSIEPIITDIQEIEGAVNAYINRTIADHPERLH